MQRRWEGDLQSQCSARCTLHCNADFAPKLQQCSGVREEIQWVHCSAQCTQHFAVKCALCSTGGTMSIGNISIEHSAVHSALCRIMFIVQHSWNKTVHWGKRSIEQCLPPPGHSIASQYSTLLYTTLLYCTVLFTILHYTTLHYTTLQYSKAHYSTTLFSTSK